jgi:2-desacetyl-2-hydroxyethyl bacteriochlorophyllide A dehydrogenase
MRAAVLHGSGDIRLVDVDRPKPRAGEVLVRVRACGVCGTDHSLFNGAYPANYPVIIGHEFAGEVAELGEEVSGLAIGDRVAVDPNRVCLRCDYCRIGEVHLCESVRSMGVHIDGANAEYALVSAINAYKMPDNVTFEQGAFCEPLACALRGIQVASLRPGDTVLVLGAGGMGNLILQCAIHAGATTVIVSEPIRLRRERALANGATFVVDPCTEDVEAAVRSIKRIGVDVVFECAGNLALQANSLKMVRKGGTVVLFGVSPQDGLISISPFEVNERELRITGSYNNPFATARALQLLAGKAVRVDNLITHRLPLERYLDVFRIFGRSDTVKLMVLMDAR